MLHNNDLNQVTWEMRAMEGAPKFEESQTLPSVSYAGFAASLGLQALEIHEPERAEGGLVTRLLPPTGPRSWTFTRILTSRPFRRTPPSNSLKTRPRRCSRVIRTHWASSGPGSNRRCRSSCPTVASEAESRRSRPAVGTALLEDVRTGRFERSLAGSGRGRRVDHHR